MKTTVIATKYRKAGDSAAGRLVTKSSSKAARLRSLLERLRFLTIVSSNFDELFEIRVAEIEQLVLAGDGDVDARRRNLESISARAHRLVERQYELLNDTLLPLLAAAGVVLHRQADWSAALRDWAAQVFETTIEPLLTPIALDPAHPFPRVLNKSLNFVMELHGRDAFGRRATLAVVQAPRILPRIYRVPPEVSGAPHGLMPLTSIVQGFAERLFPGLDVQSVHQFRVTRNSDLFVDDEEVTDLRAALKGGLLQRHFGDEVRLEVSAGAPQAIVSRLLGEFSLPEASCYRVSGPVNLARLSQAVDLVDAPALKYPPFTPALPVALADKDLFAAIRRNDILVHHPYESFAPVMQFLESASRDPDVLAIKQTVYRTGADSALMQALIDAARAGKEVTVVVELMQRTARQYEDFGLFTADDAICDDVHEVFRRLTGLGQRGALKALAQAPFTLHTMILESIRQEAENARAGKRAYIAAKVNALLAPGARADRVLALVRRRRGGAATLGNRRRASRRRKTHRHLSVLGSRERIRRVRMGMADSFTAARYSRFIQPSIVCTNGRYGGANRFIACQRDCRNTGVSLLNESKPQRPW